MSNNSYPFYLYKFLLEDTMNTNLKEAFTRIKPICDMIMVNPAPEHIRAFGALVAELKKDLLQELQQYMLFPFITHIQSKEIESKFELQRLLVDGMKEVLQRVRVASFEMCMKTEMGLLGLVFEKPKPGMIADVPEELKLSVIQCLTVLMLNIDQPTRIKMIENQVPLLAQAVFVSVHLAKLEKLRALRLAALNCLQAHTATHPQLTDSDYQITEPALELAVVNMMACILPGVLAALQDVATDANNPGHAVVVAAINSTHRVLCITMNNKHMSQKAAVTADDFINLLSDRAKTDKDVSSKEGLQDARLSAIIAARDYQSLAEFIRCGNDQETTTPEVVTTKRDRVKGSRTKPSKSRSHNSSLNNPKEANVDSVENSERPSSNTAKCSGKQPKDIPKRTPEWYEMAGDKLAIVVKSLVPLVSHDHQKVRKELAVMCYRILSECSATMQPSLAMSLDVLISLSNDPYKEVSEYCTNAVKTYFACASDEKRTEAVDSLCENFFTTLNCLPRILNNIDSNRKLSALNLLHGYLAVLSGGARPQRLTRALSASDGFPRLCDALLAAADLRTDMAPLTRHAARDVSSPVPVTAPWRRLRHLDSRECEGRLQDICRQLGAAESAELLLDRLLEMFQERRSGELVYIMNYVGSGPDSSPRLAQRIISAYIEEDVWYLPLAVGRKERPVTKDDTLDASVYNPRSWTKNIVPGLFEGTVETRYTDISYASPRDYYVEPDTCASLAEAQRNMGFSCLVTEGLGFMARRLQHDFQPYLLKTLCLILERVGSKYEYLHLAGMQAISDVAAAFQHKSVTELIAHNADYFTSQITSRLKKAWNTQSALQILSVVMEYSESNILDYLYGIVEDVLLQSCDKYYQKDLYAYLQVFQTFVSCIRKWFLIENNNKTNKEKQQTEINVLQDVIEFERNKEESERLLGTQEFESETGQSVEEMYKEDLQRKEQDALDYDDRVTHETPPPPQHIKVTISILKRCVHFIPAPKEEAILALQILNLGLPILQEYEDELLPLVHAIWGPLVSRFDSRDTTVVRRALEVLVTMTGLSKDFIRARSVKEVLPHIYKFLKRSASDSHLKDTGSFYRLSQPYNLQVAALTALPSLVVDMMLDETGLEEAMGCVQVYLSKKQPKPLQILAVKFFKELLDYNYGAAWQHLRRVCANSVVLSPPCARDALAPISGTPYEANNTDFDTNVKLIFYVHK